MTMLTRKTAILAKIEGVYGTDPVPSGAANAILVAGEPTVTPMDMQTVDRDIIRAYFGNAEKLPTGVLSKVQFKCEVAGSGTPGDVPGWGALLRACGFSETITAGVNVVYSLVTDEMESVTLYVNRDGVLHKLTGARGTVKMAFTIDAIPYFEFDFMGLFNAVTDAAMPAVTLSGWKTPLPVTAVNTPAFSLHGYTPKTQSISIDLANVNTHKAFINDTEAIMTTDRKPAGSISMEANRVAEKDWWTTVRSITTGAMSLTHGTQAGNKVIVTAPKVQIHSPTYGDHKGILMLNGNLVFAPDNGNDELIVSCE